MQDNWKNKELVFGDGKEGASGNSNYIQAATLGSVLRLSVLGPESIAGL